VLVGQQIEAGEVLLTMGTTQTLAPVDGTVRGVFAAEGDTLTNTTVLNVAPLSKYTVTCTIQDAYESIDTLYVRLGETVYIRCKKDGTHKAEGIVTAVSGSQFTVQTTAGELYMEETVYIYRSEAYTVKSRIGSGTVGRTPEIAVAATGGLLALHVSEGEAVERGQLLFETVEGALDAGASRSDTVTADTGGVVAQLKVSAGQKVSKGDALLTLYQPERYVIAFAIDEDLLDTVAVGDAVDITFHWNEEAATPVRGTVTGISYVSAETEETESQSTGSSAAQYTGYATFTADSSVRVGMSVTVTTLTE
jgi:multidrug resistance efflux pump